MQVSVEKTSNLGRKITVTLPVESMKEAVASKLDKIRATAKLDGFRPGKVPLSVIKQRYGKALEAEVVGELVQKNLPEALQSEKLNPAAMPNVESIKAEQDEPLEFVATFEIFPEIELVEFNTINVDDVKCDIVDADLDDMLKKIRGQHSEWSDVERPAHDGDRLTIDFKGTIDDVAFEGGEAEKVPLTIGSKSFIPGFEEGLIDAKVGEERTIAVTFPEDYHVDSLAGKAAKFAVTVHKIEQATLPELDEEFVKKMGIESGEVEAFKTQVREHMDTELARALKQKMKGQVFDSLIEKHSFDIPTQVEEQEIQSMYKQMNPNEENPTIASADVSEKMRSDAKKRVQLGLIVTQIVKKHEIKPDAARVRTHLEDMAKSYQYPDEMVSWYYEDKERMEGIESVIMEDQVVEKVLQEAQKSEKKLSYDEVMNPQSE